jgi:tetrahydromethanopterin S-methyltransferase subunit G
MGDISDYLDKRLDRLENKVDMLLSKYWQLVGMATVVSSVFTLVIHFILK